MMKEEEEEENGIISGSWLLNAELKKKKGVEASL